MGKYRLVSVQGGVFFAEKWRVGNENSRTEYKQSTEENDLLKQFMELINQQNMGEQSQEFMELFKYAAGMQIQLAVMADELQGVREQLSAVKDRLMETDAQA